MVLFALALAVQQPSGLPAWAYTYDLPGGGVVYPGGFGGGGFGGGGFGGGGGQGGSGGGFGGGQEGGSGTGGQGTGGQGTGGGTGGDGTTGSGTPGGSGTGAATPAAPKVALGDLIPEFKGPSYALGERVDDALVARALLRLDNFGNVLLTVDDGGTVSVGGGGARTSYLLDDHNTVQFGTSFVYVAAEGSRTRFDATRAAIERRFGAPISGQRIGTATLTLNWRTPDGIARLDLDTGSNNTLWIRATLARASGPDRYYPPVPQETGG